MMNLHLNNYLASALIVFLITLCIKMAKNILITHTISMSRTTDDGETLGVSANATIFSSHEDRHKMVQEVMDYGDRRKFFTAERFNARIDEEIAKNQGVTSDTRLKSI